MKKKLITFLKVLIFLSLGLFLVWFALKDVDATKRAQIKAAFSSARYSWVFLSLALGVLSHISRSMRWRLMLQTLGHKPRLSNTFFAVMIGYMANYAPIPRLGEASRCGILTRYEKIPFTESFGTVIAERLIDVLCLFLVFVITFFVQFDRINGMAHIYVIDPLALRFSFISSHPIPVILLLVAAVVGLFL
ncbi:MAG TPA: lysylphosphatidylglycerol synthase transmembrane domain-containing protein, partial [Bacteroidia bacterium]|nr:lysylphosphatidylglycerol synthase transmembrane domain-containing protein [Bacteroidia bacterium]